MSSALTTLAGDGRAGPVDPLRRSELAAAHLHASSPKHTPSTFSPSHDATLHVARLLDWLTANHAKSGADSVACAALRGRTIHDHLLAALLTEGTAATSLEDLLRASAQLRTEAHDMLKEATDPEMEAQLMALLVRVDEAPANVWDRIIHLTLHPNPNVYVRAQTALEKLVQRESAPDHVWEWLIRQAADCEMDTDRYGALEALCILADGRPVPDTVWNRAVRLTADPIAVGDYRALEILGQLASRASVPDQVWRRLEELANHVDPWARSSSIAAIGELGRREPPPGHIWRLLADLALQADPEVSRTALGALGRLSSDHATPEWLWDQFLSLFSQPGVHRNRSLTIKESGQLGTLHVPDRIWERLANLAAISDTAVSVDAIAALGQLGCHQSPPVSTWELLLDLLDDQSQVARAARGALKLFCASAPPPESTWEQLTDCAAIPDPETRLVAALALARAGKCAADPDFVWETLAGLATNPVVSLGGIVALSHFGSHQPAPAAIWNLLTDLATQPDQDVRFQAIEALGHLSVYQPAPRRVMELFTTLIGGNEQPGPADIPSCVADFLAHTPNFMRASDSLWRLPDLLEERLTYRSARPEQSIRFAIASAAAQMGRWRERPWAAPEKAGVQLELQWPSTPEP